MISPHAVTSALQPADVTEVPFHLPDVTSEEIGAVVRALTNGQLAGGGPVGRRVQAALRELTGARHALLTTSCSHAMELALMAARVGPGDEVILPSFTFSSTANAVLFCGAAPIFAEINADTFTLDPADVQARITPRTRAMMPVHYAGVAADMDALQAIASRHNLLIIEDAAQGVGARYLGRALGTLGHIGCYSFHGSKNFTCGEGGALLTDDDALATRAEVMAEKGTNRQAFLRGDVDKYTWVERGSSYVLSDVLAALLETQLQRIEAHIAARAAIHRQYTLGLNALAQAGLLTLPTVPPECASNYHIYPILTRSVAERDFLLESLRRNGIGATFHYVPLHSAPFARETLGCTVELPVTDSVSGRLLRLPIYPGLREDQVQRVIAVIVRSMKRA